MTKRLHLDHYKGKQRPPVFGKRSPLPQIARSPIWMWLVVLILTAVCGACLVGAVSYAAGFGRLWPLGCHLMLNHGALLCQ